MNVACRACAAVFASGDEILPCPDLEAALAHEAVASGDVDRYSEPDDWRGDLEERELDAAAMLETERLDPDPAP